MDMNLAELIDRLRKHPVYPSLFKKAFGSEEINTQRFFFALTQFQGNIISAGSKYDQFLKNPAVFNDREKRGLELFRLHCESCHREPLFTDFGFSSNELGNYTDEGRYHITQKPEDMHLFKTPSLRNVLLTRPYMHDGRLFTLEAVLNHYASGVVHTQNLDPILNANGTLGIPLTAAEKSKIIAFLKTLTDHQFLTDSRFAEF
jgi:cytochrome c peroxidase